MWDHKIGAQKRLEGRAKWSKKALLAEQTLKRSNGLKERRLRQSGEAIFKRYIRIRLQISLLSRKIWNQGEVVDWKISLQRLMIRQIKTMMPLMLLWSKSLESLHSRRSRRSLGRSSRKVRQIGLKKLKVSCPRFRTRAQAQCHRCKDCSQTSWMRLLKKHVALFKSEQTSIKICLIRKSTLIRLLTNLMTQFSRLGRAQASH